MSLTVITNTTQEDLCQISSKKPLNMLFKHMLGDYKMSLPKILFPMPKHLRNILLRSNSAVYIAKVIIQCVKSLHYLLQSLHFLSFKVFIIVTHFGLPYLFVVFKKVANKSGGVES